MRRLQVVLRVVAAAPHMIDYRPHVLLPCGVEMSTSPLRPELPPDRPNKPWDPEAGIRPDEMNGQIGRVDFDVRFAVFQYRVVWQSAGELI